MPNYLHIPAGTWQSFSSFKGFTVTTGTYIMNEIMDNVPINATT